MLLMMHNYKLFRYIWYVMGLDIKRKIIICIRRILNMIAKVMIKSDEISSKRRLLLIKKKNLKKLF